ncbi:4-hydroxy-tetrahydrodipicolinate synthase [Paraburkholderia silvatlantica]|uniref:4-hydroxy-tetrahydrodipicolinate synthase n=1 Tax=Paraburkholderia silvatlantica TaxID=321895 RepID=A0A2U1AHA0_9BURK|nr:4-hydroxy-tetrahydrodipicolinate synthase [Paraburkholderia silvatlantica]MBB2929528.1 4-hydroxy-tetrahydrodipicolinate synthase [Paraburkholderia silvatlantica]PVY35782.1 dihydrodipicolinate synthase [Paraburkholderia silvatlantica]PXW39730.1 dihydrodipicolinate synthase [Paraburkholderia silvatlantica]PYE21943.1 dihydrodipicolinate synthase [Paraburkholderia silvatlantica]TDQ99352.1 dihydrodipicolinate synthase [Paraburkholderia silvatlantica]
MANGTQDGITLQGSIPAIVTPMHEDGSLDLPAFRKLIDWHVEEGTDALVVVGTSGESATLNVEEHILMIRTAVEHAAGRMPIIAGAGGNSTAEAIELTKHAKEVGAQASLQVVPYYNKPTQEGMYRHFAKIAEDVDLPVILYNVPGRTVADMANETILRLAEVPGIIAVKEATGNIDRAAYLIKHAPNGFRIFSGDDPTAIALMLLGGHGNISVTANVAPRQMSDLCKAALAGDAKTARAIHMKLLSLHKNLFIESNPIPVKWALQELGRIEGGIRLPLTPLDARYHDVVRAALREAGLAG